jgi:hypothetical protein
MHKLIGSERESSENQVLEKEEAEANLLLESVKSQQGPVPKREPHQNVGMEGWWVFDASYTVEIENAVLRRDYPSMGLWKYSVYPDVHQLQLNIGGNVALEGLSSVFPNLEKLVIDDPKECLRKAYCLEELRNLAPTLRYLELNLSGQWMSEGSNVVAPIALLTKLRELRVRRLRDGRAEELKPLENLRQLERLFFEGQNMLYDNSETNDVLDLSKLKGLKSAVFVECSFCAFSEKGKHIQALVLPQQQLDVMCVNVFHSKWTGKLLGDLANRGVRICEKDEYPSELDKKYGAWYPI